MDLEQALNSRVFHIHKLIAMLNKKKRPKLRLAELDLFDERGITGKSVDIGYKGGQVILVPEKERGADGTVLDDNETKIVTFKALHLPVAFGISADDILAIKPLDPDDEEAEEQELKDLVDEKTDDALDSLDATIEFLRWGAVYGKIYGANGNLLVNLFHAFDIDEQEAYDDIDFAEPLIPQLQGVLTNSEEHQTGAKATGYVAECSREYFDELQQNDSFVRAMERYKDGEVFREDIRGGVPWQGIVWCLNTQKVGDKRFVPAGEAVVIPRGKKGLFLTRFAPANYNETAGTKGLPYYAKTEARKFNKGLDGEAQTNPLNVCTNLLAVRRLRIK